MQPILALCEHGAVGALGDGCGRCLSVIVVVYEQNSTLRSFFASDRPPSRQDDQEAIKVPANSVAMSPPTALLPLTLCLPKYGGIDECYL